MNSINQNVLVESKEEIKDINKIINNEDINEIFTKVKALVLLPDNTHLTIEMVASYYEVGLEAINSIIKKNKHDFHKYGLKILKGMDLKKFKNNSNYKSRAKAIALFDKIALLKIAFLLSESQVAHQIREEILIKYPCLYNHFLNSHILKLKKHEQQYQEYLEFSFGKENIQRQVQCGSYYIDFVLFNNIAIEIDENGHSSYDKKNELIRSEFILKNGYSLVRFNPHKNKPFEIIEKILKINNKKEVIELE